MSEWLRMDACMIRWRHLLIHSGYFYTASSSPLLLRGATDYSLDAVSELTAEALQAIVSEGLAQGPYVAARVDFEPPDTRNTEPPRTSIDS